MALQNFCFLPLARYNSFPVAIQALLSNIQSHIPMGVSYLPSGVSATLSIALFSLSLARCKNFLVAIQALLSNLQNFSSLNYLESMSYTPYKIIVA